MAANAAVILQLQTQAAPQLAQLVGGTKALTVAQLAQVTAAQRLEQQTLKTAAAGRLLDTADQKVAISVAQAARAQDQAALSALRLANAQDKAARGSSLGTQFADGLKSGLLGIVGPAALAVAALGTVAATADSFKRAFSFKAELDAVNLSIQTNLTGVRDSGQVFAEAAAFADRYRLTQKETSDILASSTDILRVSTSSVGDLESALLRLQSRDVSKPISEAARALRELNSGDVTSIKELFNVSAVEANRMKNEIAAGGDAVLVLNGYLERAGVGMEVLENRAKGAKGAINEAAVAQERLTLAQAKIAEGPGAVAVNVQASALNLLAGQLGDDTKATAAFTASLFENFGSLSRVLGALAVLTPAVAGHASAVQQNTAITTQAADTREAYRQIELQAAAAIDVSTAASQRAATALAEDIAKKQAATAESQKLAQAQATLGSLGDAVAGGLQTASSAAAFLALRYGFAKDEALKLINAQAALANVAKVPMAGITEDRLTRDTPTDRAAGRAAGQAAQADAAQARLRQLIATGSATQKTTALQQQYTEAVRQFGRNSKEAIDAQTRLLEAQQSAAKTGGAGRVSAAQTTAQQLTTVEQNSGLQLAKIQRENQERLRDQQEDFEVGRVRDQEDFARQRRRLLAQGQRGQAARLADDFKRDQQREQEDFDRQRRRTLRNAAEGTGDTTDRADLRSQQIADRAALRGVRPSGLPPAAGHLLPGAAGAQPRGAAPPQQIAQISISGVVNLDGKQVGMGVWPTIAVLVDEDLAVSLAQIGVPNSGQSAIAGVG